MVLAERDISHTVVNNSNSVPDARASQQECPSLPLHPPPFPGEGALFLHSVILRVLREGRAFGLATSLLGESKAAEMCTTHGRNYVARLTSEIFSPPSFPSLSLTLPLLFSTNYSKTGEIDRFLVQVGLFRCTWT